MIIINYDPILGCTGWEIINPIESRKQKIIYKMFRGNGGETLHKFLNKVPLPDKRDKKQKKYEWDILKRKNNE